MRNTYGDAPYTKFAISTATWTKAFEPSGNRRRLAINYRSSETATFFFALQNAQPVTTDVAQEVLPGDVVSFEDGDMPTSALWFFQSSGVAVDIFASEASE